MSPILSKIGSFKLTVSHDHAGGFIQTSIQTDIIIKAVLMKQSVSSHLEFALITHMSNVEV